MKRKNRNIVLVALVILLIGGGSLFYFLRSSHNHDHSGNMISLKKEIYHCPMHPHIVSDRPGTCPICNMDLVKVEDESEHLNGGTDSNGSRLSTSSTGEKEARKILFYRHPMQPDITAKTPAKDAMGMDYIPVYEDELEPSEPNDVSSGVGGRSSFALTTEQQQFIGVTSAVVEKRPLSKEIRATGRVAFDPELYTAVEEYRQALITKKALGESDYKGIAEQMDALAASSRTKLKLMGLTDNQIQKIGPGQSSPLNLLLPAGKVWVYAEVFEYEVSGIRPGQSIEAEAPSVPGYIFKGKISSVSPILNAPTRTVRVRAEVPDPNGLLRPDIFLNVRILNDLGDKLSIPDNSVLHTGTDAYVFVIKDNRRFEPRLVELGAKSGPYYEVISGLSEGEMVVTGANFLIDSEAKLKAVLNSRSGESGSNAHSGHGNNND